LVSGILGGATLLYNVVYFIPPLVSVPMLAPDDV